jgi:hypothetical protein
MNRVTSWTLSLLILSGIFIGSTATADSGKRYTVKITNITRGQIITPPVVIVHNGDFHLFALGAPASSQLAALAEDGVTAPLVSEVGFMTTVAGVIAATAPLMPGSSLSLEFMTWGPYNQISLAGMLATSNDAFFAIRGLHLPKTGTGIVYAEAYDAGSEGNSESCAFIPGPPCGHPGMRDTASAEGYVHIHAGIHGIGDLMPTEFDWRNPVAEIMVQRMP